MKRLAFLICSIFLLAAAAIGQTGDLPRSTPAEQGIDTQAVTAFLDSLMAMPETDIHHVMVLRHGKVVAEMHPAPFRAQDAHTLYSESKTFVAMAVGIAIGENRLRLTDRVATFFPDQLPDSISSHLAQMTVADLLTMNSGIKPDWTMRNNHSNWIKTWLAKPVEQPGSKFQYDSMCSFMLSAIVQRVTGRTMLDYLKEHLFRAMNITEVGWEQSPDGINTGGWGLWIQAESQAKLGLLLLQGGQWNGRQLVPAEWITQAITPRTDLHPDDAPTDGNQGYGYHIWGSKWPKSFLADGALGQYVVCLPTENMVVVINEASNRGHGVLGCIWNVLMPGVDKTTDKNANKAQKTLQKRCDNASLPLPTLQKKVKNDPLGTLALEQNRHQLASITILPETITLTYADGANESIALGKSEWKYTPLKGFPPYSIGALSRFKGLPQHFEVAAAGGWVSPNVWRSQLHYVDWVSATTIEVDTQKGTVTLTDNYDRKRPETIRYIKQ